MCGTGSEASANAPSLFTDGATPSVSLCHPIFVRSFARSFPPRQRQTRLRAASSLGEPRPTDRPTGSGWPAIPASFPPGCARAVRLDLTPARERDDRLGRGFGQAARLHHGDPAEAAPGGEHTRTARPVRSRAQLGAEWEHRWRREGAEWVQSGCRDWMQSGSTDRAERVQSGCRVGAEAGCRGVAAPRAWLGRSWAVAGL